VSPKKRKKRKKKKRQQRQKKTKKTGKCRKGTGARGGVVGFLKLPLIHGMSGERGGAAPLVPYFG
jgi:hypothetical protein